ncbi:MAG: orotidine-5'-phosphate decarboxylase [Candidatus Hydrogenedentota bacterium]
MPTELIAVLDVDTEAEALTIVEACGPCEWFKIGAQLFTRCGPSVVKAVQDRGKKVFLDLKYHDIPNTVASAAKAAADLGVGLFTVHASGGRPMIEAARRSVEGSGTRILAVTVLTSMDAGTLRDDIGIDEPPAKVVPRWAAMAVEAGAHGIVCSAQEIGAVRAAIGAGALVVTPGIRPAWASPDDQARIMTPQAAAKAGASMIVVGRPILKHPNPAEAVEKIIEELQA